MQLEIVSKNSKDLIYLNREKLHLNSDSTLR